MSFDVQFPGLGLEFTINRVALSIGGFNIYWYGVIIAAGMVLAMLFAFRNADDFGINSEPPDRCDPGGRGYGNRLRAHLLYCVWRRSSMKASGR